MRLIGLTVVLTVGLTLAPLAAKGQQAVKPVVGVFAPWSASGTDQFQHLLGAFREGLRDLAGTIGEPALPLRDCDRMRLAEIDEA